MTETEALNAIQLFSFGLRIELFWDFFVLTFFFYVQVKSVFSTWNVVHPKYPERLVYVDRMIPKKPQAVP